MPGILSPTDFAACARCGSGRVHPKLLVMGPIAGIDSDSRSFICESCGHEGLPVFFDTAEIREQFEAEKKGVAVPAAKAPREGVLSIPILPVLTEPLFDLKLIELVQLATVTGVAWKDRAVRATAYRVGFQEYWDAIGGPRYNASRVFMLDLAGINRASPNFDVMRHLVKRCEVWLDLGAREPGEVMDGYMLDVERVVAGSKTLASLEDYIDLHALSADVLPCLDWDGQVRWLDPRERRTDVREVAKSLKAIGFRSLCVMDTRRLGTGAGPDPALLAALEGLDLELYLGGGLQESDVPALGERGFAGGFVDPYTPVIRDLLRAKREEPTAAPAPEPTARPSPSTRAVPDSG